MQVIVYSGAMTQRSLAPVLLSVLLTGSLLIGRVSANRVHAQAPQTAPAAQAPTASDLPWTSQTVVIPTNPTSDDLPGMMKEMTRVKARLDDWPQLARYREANATQAPPASGEARVLFLGDSITDSWDDPKFGGFFPGKPYINRGISGQTTPQMLLRMRADVLAHKPKVLVLLAGTNDISGNTGRVTNEQIQDNITMIAELATLHGIKVVLSSILPTSNYHAKPGDVQPPQTVRRPLERIRALNTWLKAYADANRHIYLDYYAATTDAQGMLKTELSADDLHPNIAGYQIMAPLAEAAIAKALALK
jgi:lysophospholipase L1-like esterase